MSIPGPSTVEVPVLIVGAGPAGLALSAALARYGVGHLLVERHRGTAHTPRAHIINQRTVEILRHLGIGGKSRRPGVSWCVPTGMWRGGPCVTARTARGSFRPSWSRRWEARLRHAKCRQERCPGDR
jgi:2-polyprenyl-6-methoxyphenol hydroxylase-like FAD-dependent oxidoreductase